jgi:NAD-dependent SIR2 family protein deacetylase
MEEKKGDQQEVVSCPECGRDMPEEEWKRKEEEGTICPYCQKEVEMIKPGSP